MKITVYTVSYCPFSKQEKEYLKSLGLQFEEKNLEENPQYLDEMLKVSNNFAGTPVTVIQKDDGSSVVLKGFTKEEFDKVLETQTPQSQVSQTQPPQQTETTPPPALPTPPTQQDSQQTSPQIQQSPSQDQPAQSSSQPQQSQSSQQEESAQLPEEDVKQKIEALLQEAQTTQPSQSQSQAFYSQTTQQPQQNQPEQNNEKQNSGSSQSISTQSATTTDDNQNQVNDLLQKLTERSLEGNQNQTFNTTSQTPSLPDFDEKSQ